MMTFSLKMLFVSLWYFSTYLLSVFGLKSCILPIVSSFFFTSSSFQICNVPLSCLFGKRSQSGLVFPLGRRVCMCVGVCVCVCACVHRHLVCASLQCSFCVITSLIITHSSFCIDLTPKFYNTWVQVTSYSLFFFFLKHLLVLVGLLWVSAVCCHPEHQFFFLSFHNKRLH